MRLGRASPRPALLLTFVLAPTVAGCGLFDRGPTVEEAFEYLPADTFEVRFADRGAMAERLGLDDLDPRDLSEADVDDYVSTLADDREEAIAATQLTRHLRTMKDAPLNDLDVAWEARAAWGDDPAAPSGEAYVWKVGDDVDFGSLADDLEDKGYDEERSGELRVYTHDPATLDGDTIRGVYPAVMASVLLDEEEQLVVASVSAEPLDEIAEVIADDADSLADDGGAMDDLLAAADGDPEIARLVTAGPRVCAAGDHPWPQNHRARYDLGRPESRGFFISPEDPMVVLALGYETEDAAEEEIAARAELVERGVDARTAQSFDELGDFELDQDGRFLLIEQDWERGTAQALAAEDHGSGPGSCPRAAD